MKLKAFRIILVIALLLTIAISVSANESDTFLCFLNGNEYLKLSKSEKLFYVQGLADMAILLFYWYDIEKNRKLIDKMETSTAGQMLKIYNKYLEEHPEELHYAAAYTYFNAINEIVFKE